MIDESPRERTVDRPIFIIGTGRSGTTLMLEILTRHPSLAWVCQYMHFPPRTWTRRFRQRSASLFGNTQLPLLRRIARQPQQEPYEMWRRFYKGFSAPVRDLDERDVSPIAARQIREAFAAQTKVMRRSRFVTKYTGWSRIRFLDAVFPDALYLNVVRDGRAVAASLMNVDWWHGWAGPGAWRWGPLGDEDARIWQESNQSFYVLAILHWKILMQNFTQQGSAIGERYRQVRYEDLIEAPEETLQGILDWTDLPLADSFKSALQSLSLYDANVRWRKQIAPQEQVLADRLLGDTLKAYGYGA